MDHSNYQPLPPYSRRTTFGPGVQSTPIQFQWMVAIQKFNGASYLLSIPLSGWDLDKEALHHLHGGVRSSSLRSYVEQQFSMLLTKTIVGTARANYVMPYNLDPREQVPVSLQDFEQNPLLTEIYQTRARRTASTSSRESIISEPPWGYWLTGQNVIVFRCVLDKEKTTWLLMCLLIISPVAGILVGLLSHRSDVGVAVGAAIFAVASFLQGLAVWFS